MKNKNKKRKQKKPRSIIALEMILNCKGGAMHDKRNGRGGAKNKQREIEKEYAD